MLGCVCVRWLYPHSWGDRWWRAGHWEDWEELFKQPQPSKIKQGGDGGGESWGPHQAPERDPTARMLLSCINKQQQLLRSLSPPHPPPQPPLLSPKDPCPVKFSRATTANKTQSLCAPNCEWHQQMLSLSLLHGFVVGANGTAGGGRGPDWMFAYV